MNVMDYDENDSATITTASTVATNSNIYETPLEVVYQDACMAVINKPQGMTVMGGRPSLIRCDLLLPLVCTMTEKEQELSPRSDKALGKPRPVHRLDNATGGLLVLAKTSRADHTLRAAFMNRTCQKRYRALLIGKLDFTSCTATTLPPYTTLFNHNNDTKMDNNIDDCSEPVNKSNSSNDDDHHNIHQPDAVIMADVDGKISKTWIRVVRHIDANQLRNDADDAEDDDTNQNGTSTTNHNNVISESTLSTAVETQSEKNRAKIVALSNQGNTTTNKPHCYTMVDLWPVTGRRHQLRKHMKLIGYSIYGDTRYIAASLLAERYHHRQQSLGEKTSNPKLAPPASPPLCLWAMEITIPHPYTGIKMTFTVPNHDDADWFHPILWKSQSE